MMEIAKRRRQRRRPPRLPRNEAKGSSAGPTGLLGTGIASLGNALVEGEDRLAVVMQDLLAIGQLPGREDFKRLRRRMARLRVILLELDELIDELDVACMDQGGT